MVASLYDIIRNYRCITIVNATVPTLIKILLVRASLVPRLYPCARTQTNQKCNESEVKPGRTSHVQYVI